jgi:hypothetical protein
MNKYKRLTLSLGALAVAVVATGAVISSPKPPRDSVYMADGPVFNDVHALTDASHAVAHVRVVGVGQSYRVPFDPPVVHVAPPPTDGPKGMSLPVASDRKAAPTTNGLLKTDVTVEVVEGISGTALRTGDRMTVAQLGGTDERGGRIVTEDDPIVQVGEQEIQFLRQDPASGKFWTTGGGQGRYKVSARGIVTAVQHDTAMAKAHNGKPAEFLKSEIKGVRSSNRTSDKQ